MCSGRKCLLLCGLWSEPDSERCEKEQVGDRTAFCSLLQGHNQDSLSNVTLRREPMGASQVAWYRCSNIYLRSRAFYRLTFALSGPTHAASVSYRRHITATYSTFLQMQGTHMSQTTAIRDNIIGHLSHLRKWVFLCVCVFFYLLPHDDSRT